MFHRVFKAFSPKGESSKINRFLPLPDDRRIRESYHVSRSMVERTRCRFVEEGIQVAVWGKKREVFKEKILTGDVEAKLVALRCSQPPSGYAKWSLQLLADHMVE